MAYKMTYQERRAAGLCTQCGKPNPTPERCRCPDCMDRGKAQRKANREYAARIGVCTICKKGTPYAGKKICEDCLDKISRYDAARNTSEKMQEVYKRRKEKCVANGLCYGCRKRPARKGYTYCTSCYLKIRSRQIQKKSEISRSERPIYGLCYICGQPLDSIWKTCKKCHDRQTEYLIGKDGTKCDLGDIFLAEPSRNLIALKKS